MRARRPRELRRAAVGLLTQILGLLFMPAGTARAEFHHVADCLVCHVFPEGPNLYNIAPVIQTPNSGPRPVAYTSLTGLHSLADGDEVYDGVCEVCHTKNLHHRNDGSDNTQHFDGQRCTQCHAHTAQFTAPYAQAHRTHLTADLGPHLTCVDCHLDPALLPAVFADGQGFANTAVCDTCHSPGGSYDGVNDPVIGAKSNWATGVYDHETLPAGKEKWCVGCHDEAASQISGVRAPNIAGDENAATRYGTGWGFYKTGHGLPSNQVYPASGVKGAGRECLDCHDARMPHIDGKARTYRADGDYLTWDPASSGYQNGYRLKDVASGYGGKYPMHIPRTGHVFPPGFRESQEFALCFSCHDESRLFNGGDPVTGSAAGTGFRNLIGGVWTSLHDLHTDGRNGPLSATTPQYDSDFDGVADSRVSCPACHNVHGSPSPAMVRRGELISTSGTADKVPALDFQYTPEGSYPLLGDSTGGKTRFIGSGAGTVAKNGICNMCHNDQTIYSRSPVSGGRPSGPSNVAPADGATSVETTPLLVSSAYSDPEAGHVHQASQWQITANPGDYSAPIYSSGATADLTAHRAATSLRSSKRYHWRVRHLSSAGGWSEFSAETAFSTAAGPPGSPVILNPSGVVAAGSFLPSANTTWASALDGDDGDTSGVYLCCSSPQAFTVSMDDPVGLEGTTIRALTVHVVARYLAGPWPNAVPHAGSVTVGYKTGTATRWSPSASTDTSGRYTSISSPRFVVDSDGGTLEPVDIDNLAIVVRRDAAGPPLLRVTEIRVEVEYSR